MGLFPVLLELAGQRILVVGGGEGAGRRARGLLRAGAVLRVVAPEVSPELSAAAAEVHRRPVCREDLSGVRLAFACADSASVNDQVAIWAREAGVFCNQTGQAESGDLRLGATWQQQSLLAQFSSGRELPFLAQALRDHFAATLPAGLGERLPGWTARRERSLELEDRDGLSALRSEIRAFLGLPEAVQ